MAKPKGGLSLSSYRSNSKKRPGVHAKTKNSVHKNGKNYNKPYRGQGR